MPWKRWCRPAISEPKASRMAGRQGVFAAVFRNANKDGLFSLKPPNDNDLGFSDSFVAFRLFSSSFGFCERNDTRNVTRGDGLPRLPVGRSPLKFDEVC